MSDYTYIKCGIESCSQFFEYKHDAANPLALKGIWTDPSSEKPINTETQIGNLKEIRIWGALKINLYEPFWVLYLDPFTINYNFQN